MLPSPSSSPRQPLDTCTNFPPKPVPRQPSFSCFPTPPNEKPKRQAILTGHGPNKRIKLTPSYNNLDSDASESDSDDEYEDSDEDVAMGQAATSTPLRGQRNAPHNQTTRLLQSPPNRFDLRALSQASTYPILRSFISSHKADVFNCISIRPNAYLTPPYACSYSHSAKSGGTPYLAVANEEGTVHVFNTTKRKDWDVAPTTNTLQPHNNGIFEIKWDESDTHIATCSGDQSARITNVETQAITHVLRGHSSTIKCVSWDPHHKDLLATGSRDGTICLWDLRTSEKHGDTDLNVAQPTRTIPGAHQEPVPKTKPRTRKGKQVSAPPGITNLLFPEANANGLVSSGSADGILKYWDLRTLPSRTKSRSTKPQPPPVLFSSPLDPTTLHASRRPRGILSLTPGRGPTAGLIFALGADSHIHTYSIPSLQPQLSCVYAHDDLKVSSFYVTLSVSPCGRWLASGATSTDGSAFLFDVANAPSPNPGVRTPAVVLRGQTGEVGAVDWASDSLATCADDGTVRIWRPDVEVYRDCLKDPEESRWNWLWPSA